MKRVTDQQKEDVLRLHFVEHLELTPIWWTPRKGLLSTEIHQCQNERHDQNHSSETRYGV